MFKAAHVGSGNTLHDQVTEDARLRKFNEESTAARNAAPGCQNNSISSKRFSVDDLGETATQVKVGHSFEQHFHTSVQPKRLNGVFKIN